MTPATIGPFRGAPQKLIDEDQGITLRKRNIAHICFELDQHNLVNRALTVFVAVCAIPMDPIITVGNREPLSD
jgi:hypothetical protein